MIKHQHNIFGGVDEVYEPLSLDGKPKRKNTQANGYAGLPGAGPEGEKCKTCQHHLIRDYRDKIYHKCALLGNKITHGVGTDIRVKSPACEYWENWDKLGKMMELPAWSNKQVIVLVEPNEHDGYTLILSDDERIVINDVADVSGELSDMMGRKFLYKQEYIEGETNCLRINYENGSKDTFSFVIFYLGEI